VLFSCFLRMCQPPSAPCVRVLTWTVATVVMPSGLSTKMSTSGVPGGPMVAKQPRRRSWARQ
jgi:hypothetical protein